MLQISSWHQIVSASFESPPGVLLIWTLQAFVVLGIAWAAVKLDRSHTAAIRCRVWLIALVVTAALPPLSFFFRTLPGPRVAVIPAVAVVSRQLPVEPGLIAPPHFSSWVLVVWVVMVLWITGALVSLFRLTSSLWKLHRIKSAAEPSSAGELCPRWNDAAANPLAQVPLALSRDIRSPGLAGLLRPTILLPADIASWATAEEIAAMLRHEVAHIERHDHLAGLFVSIVRALLFFHPMVHLASNQISLERELACDERVLGLGANPSAYAESILKAVERSILADTVHQVPSFASSFASRKTLERRLEMILNNSRSIEPSKPWRFLLLPIALIVVITWLVMPQGHGLRRADADGSGSQSAGNPLATDFSHEQPNSLPGKQQTAAVVDRGTIWVERVQRGSLLVQVRGLAALTSAGAAGLNAQVTLPDPVTRDVRAGQPVSLVDAGGGEARGSVTNIDRQAQNGLVTIKIALAADSKGESTEAMRPGMTVDAFILVDRLEDVLQVGRPAIASENSTRSLFKIDADGNGATRVQVRFGKASVNSIAILDGLSEGDRVILSDISALAGVDRIVIK